MSELVAIAEKYLGANADVRRELVGYYNVNCIELVKPSRRYAMTMQDNWCAMFTSVVAHMAGLRAGEFPFEVSVQEQRKLASDMGLLDGANSIEVKAGDLILYDWNSNGWANHVGFVTGVDDRNISTIEGNYSSTVKRRVLKRTSQAIAGFVRLGGQVSNVDSVRLQGIVSAVLRGEYGNGEERKKALGADYEKIQKMVNLAIG